LTGPGSVSPARGRWRGAYGRGFRRTPPGSRPTGGAPTVSPLSTPMTIPPAQVMDLVNAALEGRYAIERELGEGGMATVYLAEDLKHKRKVAIKVLKPELAAVVGAERFLGEIETTANLQHPHMLPLFDSGQAESRLGRSCGGVRPRGHAVARRSTGRRGSAVSARGATWRARGGA
jgi:hypothetical protein